MTEHKKAGGRRARRNIFRVPGKARARSAQDRFRISISAGYKIRLTKTVLGETQPPLAGLLLRHCHRAFACGDSFIRRAKEIERRRPDRDGCKLSRLVSDLLGARLRIVTKPEPLLNVSERGECQPRLNAQIDRALLARH